VGYLQASGVRDASGSFSGTDYTISEMAAPDVAQPDTANPPQVSIDSQQGLSGKQGLNFPAAPSAPPTPTVSDADLAVKAATDKAAEWAVEALFSSISFVLWRFTATRIGRREWGHVD
jgi:hypothetical protein